MQKRQNANVTKCKWDKMQIGLNANETLCNCNEMQMRQNANVTKYKWDKMLIGQNTNET